MTTKTPKELAEAAATAALDSLKAQLQAEMAHREDVRAARRDAVLPHGVVVRELEEELREAIGRSDAAFAAWRQAQEAVPHDDRSTE